MVWQDPFSCLNPRMKVGDIISRPLIRFKGYKKAQALEKVREIIRIVGLNENELPRYPHEFSGGGRQRIVIARALVSDPSFLIADEPTSSLDVSIQAQILNLLKQLKDNFNLTMLFISHDLTVIHFISNRIAVMYFGRIVEIMPREDLFDKNYHWYTKKLIDAIPKGMRKVDTDTQEERSYRINYQGCVYYHRCENARQKCFEQPPQFVEIEKDHFVVCHYPNVHHHRTSHKE
jgi:oligopeptide/dipeptide ABC transporter ATP-binding protein